VNYVSGLSYAVTQIAADFTGDEKTMDRKVYMNTTLSIQVVAPKLQERKLYQAMKLIDEVLHGSVGTERAKL